MSLRFKSTTAALLILVATMPMAAAGALSEGTKSWMWKSIPKPGK